MSKKNEQKHTFEQKTISSIQDIGKMVQQIRKESKLTQHHAALLCGVTPKFLSELETGKNKHFSLRLILRVMHFFGIELVCKKRTIK
ncbi:MAG: helix-turn-helix domain-containing protein [Bdellovibrionales bacterium]|nr:helix-turn-helix domain-containing protein [Bdellovibrionales bacterium]